jgi:predicted RNA-binding Zn-ribbon protein involved in translation (DUF1610 family)|tara:strand:- start:248 stop:631 length:384 start_codon:yes stop_codon:yes gene_type:complete
MKMKCVQCGSHAIARHLRTVDHGDENWKREQTIEAYADPKAWIFKGTKSAALKANVCTECGYVMFTISKAAAKEIGKIKKVNVAKKVAKKPPICLNCGIGGHNKPGFLCESIKNVIGLGDMQKQSNN